MLKRIPADAPDAQGGPSATAPQAYEFGPYRLEVATHRLLKAGQPISLTPKAFDVLLALIERRDRVVGKAELMRLVWPDSFVEEANLSQTIFVLRKTLSEGPDGRPFIDTVPRRGYRFGAEVRVEGVRRAMAEEVAPWLGAHTAWTAGALLVMVAVAGFGASRIGSMSGEPSRIESLVVLPFGDLSGASEQDYLADSMHDALITTLGQIGGLRVISRTSAMTYKSTSKTVPQIARELNVDAVVEGAVQRSAERVTWNLKLIEASTDRTVWAQSYERDLRNALDLHNEIARTIASRTAVTLTPRESARLAETTRVNPKVYEAYLKGRYFWNRRSEPDMRQAIGHFEEALRLDPRYAPAHSGLADSYALYGSYGWTPAVGGAWTRALAAAEKALELDELLADAHTSRARIALNYELDWTSAGKGYRRALELNPGYANAHHWYGYYLMLSGRLKEGEAEMRRALELDPLSPIINANIGMSFYVARQYDAAIAHWRKALEMHRNYRLLHVYMTTAYVGKEMYPEAVAELQKGLALSGAGSWEAATLVHIYGRMGRTEEARALLSEVLSRGDASPYDVALAYVGLGENDHAFTWLDKAVQARSGSFNELNADPMFDRLRPDPRFAALLRRMGLPTSPPSLTKRLSDVTPFSRLRTLIESFKFPVPTPSTDRNTPLARAS
jgi:TolB-like protein/DNA-binding winged helix-turn-helix (wHTH) protein/Tfp pilus assembly protein PilF